MSRLITAAMAGGSKLAAAVAYKLTAVVGASPAGGDETQSQLDQFNSFATGWIVLVVAVVSLLLLAVLVFAKVGEGTSLTRREKTLRVLVVVAFAVSMFALLSRSALWVFPLYGIIFACWAMFLLRWIAPQVGDVADYVGRAFNEEKREAARELGASQEAQSERGDAMEDVLHDMIEERGDEEVVEEAEHGDE